MPLHDQYDLLAISFPDCKAPATQGWKSQLIEEEGEEWGSSARHTINGHVSEGVGNPTKRTRSVF